MTGPTRHLRSGITGAILYALAAAGLILSQHAMVALAFRALGAALAIDDHF